MAKTNYHKFNYNTNICMDCGIHRRKIVPSQPKYEYSKDGITFGEFIPCKERIKSETKRGDGRNPLKMHKWIPLGGSQARCEKCGILRTQRTIQKVGSYLYQGDNGFRSEEYVECIDKPDNSEFYE
jgi:hypothetical protein